ncbi:hypothetical protein CCB80_09300 [Armatimonadetes bacterium Uphvl-Ar1]|nr:hypothetical protein CCB80_09300 [Armatimonadetes bacterium Uphvl-Ar1]
MSIKVSQKFDEHAIREILRRAEEIHIGAPQQDDTEAKAIIKAAEEAGLPRAAVEQALQERLAQVQATTTPGEFLFAPSADGKLYVAELISSNGATTRARFLNGSDISVPTSQTQPANFLPGSKVYANWPSFGWWNCTVISFDKSNRLLRLSDGWGNEKSFPLAEVRINPPVQANSKFHKDLIYFWDNYKMQLMIAVGVGLFVFIMILRNI